ncbi:hypothetical protein K488DRAFT_87282 [Vararia minispora EC-137]|uniref:Uncharacterized protein n=1 Tax=Vararia minispora EC-137 TaxID=1314806 RepID=A0ACB8QGX7_9AGAM|nr:hypothetical protein K488DRAFT_87282 [Vararia minispora EC-137]
MDTPTGSFLPTRHRVLRQTLPPFKTEFDETPAGPSRLSPLASLKTPFADDADDLDATPRLAVKSSLPSPLIPALSQDASVAATPSDRLRALIRGSSATPSVANRTTQLMDVPPPSITSGNDSDFEPPPRWNGNQASSSSARVRNLFSHGLSDTPRRAIVRRNSVDAGEISDSPRMERIVHERLKNKGKRKSLSDDERDKSTVAYADNNSPSSRAIDIEALRNRILSSSLNDHSNAPSDISLSDIEPAGAADERSNNHTAALLRKVTENASQGINGNTTLASSLRSIAFPSQIHNGSDLLEEDSEMQRAMGAMDSFDAETSHRGQPSFPSKHQSSTPGRAARPRAALGRAESLAEGQLSSNVARKTSGDNYKRFSVDSESLGSMSSRSQSPSRPETLQKDMFHHHRNSHSRTGSPMPEPRSRRGSVVSVKGVDNNLSTNSRGGSLGPDADIDEHLKDPDWERKHERERAWNRPANVVHSKSPPLSERVRTYSHPVHPSYSISSLSPNSLRADSPDPEVESTRERNRGSPHPYWSHTPSTHPRGSVSPIPQPARTRRQSSGSLSIPHRPSSSLSMHSSPPSTPDPEEERMRERNWNSPHPNWSHEKHPHYSRRSLSPLPSEPIPISQARTRTNSTGGAHTSSPRPRSPLPGHQLGHHQRPSSSLSSHSSHSSQDLEEEHMRERNWNSPHPSWSQPQLRPRRSVSPVPPSLSYSLTRTRSMGAAMKSSTPTSTPPAALPSRTSLAVASRPARSSLSSPHDKEPLRSTSPKPPAKPLSAASTSSIPKLVSNSQSTPLPSSSTAHVNGRTNIKGPGFSAGINWQFPRRSKMELPPLDGEEGSLERPVSKASSKIPIRSPEKMPRAERYVGKDEENAPAALRHKRANTEFIEANGAVPPRIVVETEEEDEEEVRMSLEDDHDDSMRESDLDASIVDASTPVVRPITIPPADGDPSAVDPGGQVLSELKAAPEPGPEPEPEPELEPSLVARVDSSQVKGIAQPEPGHVSSSPLPTQPSFSDLITPPKRPTFSAVKLEAISPSPSQGLPDLPDLPSDDDTAELPPISQPNFSHMKTPRPPGAWLTTPGPPQPNSAEPEATPSRVRTRANSVGTSVEQRIPPSALARTSASLGRSNTLPARTPALPGGWIPTPDVAPNTLRRKSVRFEAPPMTSESSTRTSTFTSEPLPAPAFEDTLSSFQVVEMPEQTSLELGSASIEAPSFEGVAESSPVSQNGSRSVEERPRTPERKNASPEMERKLRKSPSVRLVDEYGRARDMEIAVREVDAEKVMVTEWDKLRAAKGKERDKDTENHRERGKETARREKGKAKEEPKQDKSMSMRMPGGSLRTPRNKSAVRMLDAMGREVEEDQNDSDVTVTEVKMSRAESIAHLRHTLAELKDGFSALDSSDESRVNDAQFDELEEVSRAARETRSKIARSLHQIREQQEPRRSRWWKPMSTLPGRSLSWFFWTVFLTQFILALYMYR